MQIKVQNFYLIGFLGLFGSTILASIWAIFGRINIEFHLFLLLLNTVIFLWCFQEIKQVYKQFFEKTNALSLSSKILFTTTTLLLVAQSATLPLIADNESYYIQTIKWLNEYGLVKGVANLHPFLALTSGWHITQSAFNFSFIYSQFNDINGICLWLLLGFSYSKLDTFTSSQKTELNFIALIPLLSIYLFQFVSAPTPDLAVYCCSFLIIYLFLKANSKEKDNRFILILVLALFSSYIKPTSSVLLLFPIYLFVSNFSYLKKRILISTIISLVITVLFLIKNTITSGYPFFPLYTINPFALDYQLPESIVRFYFEQTKLSAFECNLNQYLILTKLELFKHWLQLSGLDGFFNKITVFIIVIAPLWILYFKKEKKYWIIYSLMIFQFLLLFLTSPQYRYYINFTAFFGLIFLIPICKNKFNVLLLNYISILLVLLSVTIKLPLALLTKNPNLKYTYSFSKKNILIPEQKSKLKTDFELLKKGNLTYYSPSQINLFWEIGDAPLPSTNKNEMEYFETYFGVIPQMRTNKIADGFYAKTIGNDSN